MGIKQVLAAKLSAQPGGFFSAARLGTHKSIRQLFTDPCFYTRQQADLIIAKMHHKICSRYTHIYAEKYPIQYQRFARSKEIIDLVLEKAHPVEPAV
jgi:hypothetical protein